MMSQPQIARLLRHCENVHEDYEDKDMCGDEGPEYFDMCRNEGWVQALRLVLEVNGPVVIREEPLDD